MATATETKATESTEKAPRKKRGPRKPTAFSPRIRVIVQTHKELTEVPTAVALGEAMKSVFPNLAVRAVSRHRTGAKAGGPTALTVYLAPTGYTFPTTTTTERGIRIPAEIANLLRSIAESLGKDPSDPTVLLEIAKNLAGNAAKQAAAK